MSELQWTFLQVVESGNVHTLELYELKYILREMEQYLTMGQYQDVMSMADHLEDQE